MPSTDVTLDPGTYYGGWQIGNGTKLHLNQGLHPCGWRITPTGGITEAVAAGRVLIMARTRPRAEWEVRPMWRASRSSTSPPTPRSICVD